MSVVAVILPLVLLTTLTRRAAVKPHTFQGYRRPTIHRLPRMHQRGKQTGQPKPHKGANDMKPLERNKAILTAKLAGCPVRNIEEFFSVEAGFVQRLSRRKWAKAYMIELRRRREQLMCELFRQRMNGTAPPIAEAIEILTFGVKVPMGGPPRKPPPKPTAASLAALEKHRVRRHPNPERRSGTGRRH